MNEGEERDIDRIEPVVSDEDALSAELRGDVYPKDLIGVSPSVIEVGDNPEKAMLEMFRQGGPDAVATIIETARGQYNHSDRSTALQAKLDFDAAKYVVERVLGKPREQVGDTWEDSIDRLLKDVEGGHDKK